MIIRIDEEGVISITRRGVTVTIEDSAPDQELQVTIHGYQGTKLVEVQATNDARAMSVRTIGDVPVYAEEPHRG